MPGHPEKLVVCCGLRDHFQHAIQARQAQQALWQIKESQLAALRLRLTQPFKDQADTGRIGILDATKIELQRIITCIQDFCTFRQQFTHGIHRHWAGNQQDIALANNHRFLFLAQHLLVFVRQRLEQALNATQLDLVGKVTTVVGDQADARHLHVIHLPAVILFFQRVIQLHCI